MTTDGLHKFGQPRQPSCSIAVLMSSSRLKPGAFFSLVELGPREQSCMNTLFDEGCFVFVFFEGVGGGSFRHKWWEKHLGFDSLHKLGRLSSNLSLKRALKKKFCTPGGPLFSDARSNYFWRINFLRERRRCQLLTSSYGSSAPHTSNMNWKQYEYILKPVVSKQYHTGVLFCLFWQQSQKHCSKSIRACTAFNSQQVSRNNVWGKKMAPVLAFLQSYERSSIWGTSKLDRWPLKLWNLWPFLAVPVWNIFLIFKYWRKGPIRSAHSIRIRLFDVCNLTWHHNWWPDAHKQKKYLRGTGGGKKKTILPWLNKLSPWQ